jgi:hypothetical protein
LLAGSLTLGFALTTSGSFQLVIFPRKIPASAFGVQPSLPVWH